MACKKGDQRPGPADPQSAIVATALPVRNRIVGKLPQVDIFCLLAFACTENANIRRVGRFVTGKSEGKSGIGGVALRGYFLNNNTAPMIDFHVFGTE